MIPRKRLRRGRQRGFTMVELLVTLSISVFALMGILALHKSLAQSTTRAGQIQEAVTIGSRTMETLRKKRPADLPIEVTGASSAPPYSNANYATVLGRNSLSYTVGVDVTAPSNGVWLMRVSVTWTDDANVTTTLPLEMIRTAKDAL